MSYVERFINKHCPEILKGIVVPVFTLLIMIPVAFCLVAPLGRIFGDYLSAAIIWLYNTTGFFGVAVFAGCLPFIIITGMHYGFFSYFLNEFATKGVEPFYCISNYIMNISMGLRASRLPSEPATRRPSLLTLPPLSLLLSLAFPSPLSSVLPSVIARLYSAR